MGTPGRLHLALAEALGTPPAALSILAAGSESALESAAEDWKTLLARAGGGSALWRGEPPAGWPAAVRRVVQVLRATAAHVAEGSAGPGGGPEGAARP
eukprot:417151-Pleurochrysis_carterae.AAC.1